MIARLHQFTVYFVSNDAHAVANADIVHALKFVAPPHSSGRIVRVAEQEKFCARVNAQPFHRLKVHPIRAVFIYQSVLSGFATIVAD